ncbi:MAG: alpha-L-fucosidase [Clostridia bacterium]|nr:alpha-L-fucosidase [Clostridia bacterium]
MDQNEKMSWFRDAKFGIFMHWGIYAVNGIDESWSFYKGDISFDDYMAQAKGFTAEHYDPKRWAELFKKIGAKYTVLTTKHHDGFALWDTAVSDWNAKDSSPAGRDLIGPYCDAMREAGMKVGLYFSHLDWHHPDYPSIHPHSDEWWADKIWTAPPAGEPDDLVRWEKFMTFYRAQLGELMSRFGKIDLLWFDGDWERTSEQWRFEETKEYLRSFNPAVIMNNRMHGEGDYKTPEQAMPITRPEGDFEYCVTLNNSWGYQPKDNNFKSARSIVYMLAECVGMGGNFLLDVGPKPDGTIDERSEALLLEVGDWVTKHGEAIYCTRAGLGHDLFSGASTLSKDKKTLYLFYYDIPGGPIPLRGIASEIKRISVVGSGEEVPMQRQQGFLSMPGIAWIDLPKSACDPLCTVLKVEFDEPITLVAGVGVRIE